MNPILLSRETVTFLYSITYQAHRTIDTAVWPGTWPEIQAFYQGTRGELLRQVVDALTPICGADVGADRDRMRKTLKRRFPEAWVSLKLAVLKPAGTGNVRFRRDELQFLKSVLRAVSETVSGPPPLLDTIHWLRWDLGVCLWVLDVRCPSIPKKVELVENVGQPGWREHYRVEEIALPTEEFRLRRGEPSA